MKKLILLVIIVLFVGCSIKPIKPVTRDDLSRFNIYGRFIIQESPEQIVDALNQYGEIVLKGKRNVKRGDYPVHVKILATHSGLTVVAYDR